MAVKFNPFTGQLQIDEKGSGGGGASYLDGEVQNFSALPETIGSPAVDSAYLVRQAEGAWLLNRKPAGIYIRTANTGVRASDWTYAGEFPDVFSDDKFVLYDETDSSKNLVFQLSGITTGTTRTLTVPNASGRIQVEGQAIGNTTPAAGTFTTLAANNGTLTASAPVLDLSQTWNNSAVDFVGANINANVTAAGNSSIIFRVQLGGSSVFTVPRFGGVNAANGFFTAGNIQSTFGSIAIQAGGSCVLTSDANDTLAQRRTTNPQTFRIYNTFTDASNHERGFMRWSSNVLQIGTEAGGTGSARALEFQTNGTTRLTIATTGSATFTGAIATSGEIYAGTTSDVRFASSTRLGASANGSLRLSNNALTDFDRLQFGGTTSSFPALKRSSTTLQVRLADDSAYSVLDAQLRAQGTAPATSGATGTAGDIRYDADYIYVCTAANTWKRAAIATW